MLLTENCIKAYKKQFPEDDCAFLEPGPCIGVVAHNSGECFVSPFWETEDEFMDRLERSKAENRNLFYEEWKIFVYEDGMIY